MGLTELDGYSRLYRWDKMSNVGSAETRKFFDPIEVTLRVNTSFSNVTAPKPEDYFFNLFIWQPNLHCATVT